MRTMTKVRGRHSLATVGGLMLAACTATHRPHPRATTPTRTLPISESDDPMYVQTPPPPPPSPQGTRCRTQADCSAGETCGGGGSGCGTCFTQRRECANDDECGSGRVCAILPRSDCNCNEGSHCVADCPSAGCPDRFRCGPQRHCEPQICAGDGACLPHQRCAPGAEFADPHGCAPVGCQSDSECRTQLCVNGFCVLELAVCSSDGVAP